MDNNIILVDSPSLHGDHRSKGVIIPLTDNNCKLVDSPSLDCDHRSNGVIIPLSDHFENSSLLRLIAGAQQYIARSYHLLDEVKSIGSFKAPSQKFKMKNKIKNFKKIKIKKKMIFLAFRIIKFFQNMIMMKVFRLQKMSLWVDRSKFLILPRWKLIILINT